MTFPVAVLCRHCRSRTRLERLKTDTGVLLEFTTSHIGGGDSQFGFVEIEGIRVIGTFDPQIELEVGMKVRMYACGVAEDGRPFYLFSPVTSDGAKSKTRRY